MCQLRSGNVLRRECDVVHVVRARNVQRCRWVIGLHGVPQRSDRHHNRQHNVYAVCSGNVCVVAVSCVSRLWAWKVQRRRLQCVCVGLSGRAVHHGAQSVLSLRRWPVLTR